MKKVSHQHIAATIAARLLSWVLVLVYILFTLTPTATAITNDQRKVLRSGIHYYNTDQDCGSSAQPATTSGSSVIALDPGHSPDTGSSPDPVTGLDNRDYANEPEMTNAYTAATKIKSLLEADGYTVFMTKNSANDKLNLTERANRANGSGAQLLVTLHSNQGGDNMLMYPDGNSKRPWSGARKDGSNTLLHPDIEQPSQAAASTMAPIINEGIASLHPRETYAAKSFYQFYGQTGLAGNGSSPGNTPVQTILSSIPEVYSEVDENILPTDAFAQAMAQAIKAAVPLGSGGGTSGAKNTFILGDSITALSADAYKHAFQAAGAEVTVDGSFDRGVNRPGNPSLGTPSNSSTASKTGLQTIQADKESIKSANAIVVALGTNAGLSISDVDSVMSALKAINSTAKLYWVDTAIKDGDHAVDSGRLGWVNSANQAIYSQASKNNYTVISWAKAVNDQADPPTPLPGNLTDPNGYLQDAYHVHPTPAGIAALTKLVHTSVGGSESSSSSSSACCSSSGGGSVGNSQILAFAASPLDSTWGVSDSTAEQWFLQQSGATTVIAKYGLNANNIGEITSVVKAAGVSVVFFYAYAANEGGGAGGFINHYSSDAAGGGVGNATVDAKYLADQSKIMNSIPSWIDAGNPVDFVPQNIKDAGNADFQSMPSGTVGRAYIPATAATTWEVYYPNGLKAAYNKVQDYGSPLQQTIQNIQKMGGDPAQGGSSSGGCSTGVAGEGITKAINWAKNIAEGDAYGYDQDTRTTGWAKYQSDPSCTDQCGNFDCSSFVAAALTEAGYFKTNPQFATGTEGQELEKAGFTKVASSAPTSENLQPGDILINTANHTAIYIGDNKTVEAWHNEHGNYHGGQPGDQDGDEIGIHDFYDYPWDAVYRAPN